MVILKHDAMIDFLKISGYNKWLSAFLCDSFIYKLAEDFIFSLYK